METKYIGKITTGIGIDSLIPALVAIPGSPGLYQEVFVPRAEIGAPYKIFSANLTQENTDPPVVTQLWNDTGTNWVPAYDVVGEYKLIPDTPPQDDSKVQVFYGAGLSFFIRARWRAGEVVIDTASFLGVPQDEILSNTPILVLIWP